MMLSIALFLFCFLNQEHSHDAALLGTWENMKVLPGIVSYYDKSSKIITIRHQDKNLVRVADYKIEDKVSYVTRNPKKNDLIIVLFCPKDNIVYTVVLK